MVVQHGAPANAERRHLFTVNAHGVVEMVAVMNRRGVFIHVEWRSRLHHAEAQIARVVAAIEFADQLRHRPARALLRLGQIVERLGQSAAARLST